MTARVLIVDDEANLRRMLRAVLEAEGHEVFEAADGDASGLTSVEEFAAFPFVRRSRRCAGNSASGTTSGESPETQR